MATQARSSVIEAQCENCNEAVDYQRSPDGPEWHCGECETSQHVLLVNDRREKKRSFPTVGVAEDKKQELGSMGVRPEDLEIVFPDENTQNGHEPEELENQGEQGESEMDDATPEFEEREEPREEAKEVKYVGEDQSLPDRELTEDPIAWLQRGEGELTTQIKGTTVITKKGFRVLQHKYNISTGSEVVVGPEETDQEFCRVKAWAEMPNGRRAEAHASAHVDRGDDHFLLVSMADTRAKSRALSDVTGVGAVAIEEMMGVDTDES